MGRSKGTGSVFPRGRDGRYAYQIDAGFTPRGTRRRITKGGFATKEAARTALGKRLREIATEGVPAPRSQQATVKRWADEWLPRYSKEVRPKTYQTAASSIRLHVIPVIGHRKLADLNPSDIRAVHKHAGDGNSSSTALRTHATLMAMLKAASVEGHTLRPNVFQVKPPRKAVSTRDTIPLPDALALLHAAQQRPDRARWVAALLQGMRQGECLGLTWDAIDLERATMDVSWQLQPLPYVDLKDTSKGHRIPDGYEVRHLTRSYHLVRPKTSHGTRIVPLVPWMTAALKEWQQVAPANPWELVWTEHNRPIRSATDRDAWYALQTAAGITHSSGRRFTLHEARHTCATLLLEAGVDGEVIKALLGHSDVLTTRGYQHISQALARQALESVAERLQLSTPGLDTPRLE